MEIFFKKMASPEEREKKMDKQMECWNADLEREFQGWGKAWAEAYWQQSVKTGELQSWVQYEYRCVWNSKDEKYQDYIMKVLDGRNPETLRWVECIYYRRQLGSHWNKAWEVSLW